MKRNGLSHKRFLFSKSFKRFPGRIRKKQSSNTSRIELSPSSTNPFLYLIMIKLFHCVNPLIFRKMHTFNASELIG